MSNEVSVMKKNAFDTAWQEEPYQSWRNLSISEIDVDASLLEEADSIISMQPSVSSPGSKENPASHRNQKPTLLASHFTCNVGSKPRRMDSISTLGDESICLGHPSIRVMEHSKGPERNLLIQKKPAASSFQRYQPKSETNKLKPIKPSSLLPSKDIKALTNHAVDGKDELPTLPTRIASSHFAPAIAFDSGTTSQQDPPQSTVDILRDSLRRSASPKPSVTRENSGPIRSRSRSRSFRRKIPMNRSGSARNLQSGRFTTVTPTPDDFGPRPGLRRNWSSERELIPKRPISRTADLRMPERSFSPVPKPVAKPTPRYPGRRSSNQTSNRGESPALPPVPSGSTRKPTLTKKYDSEKGLEAALNESSDRGRKQRDYHRRASERSLGIKVTEVTSNDSSENDRKHHRDLIKRSSEKSLGSKGKETAFNDSSERGRRRRDLTKRSSDKAIGSMSKNSNRPKLTRTHVSERGLTRSRSRSGSRRRLTGQFETSGQLLQSQSVKKSFDRLDNGIEALEARLRTTRWYQMEGAPSNEATGTPQKFEFTWSDQ